MTARFLSLAILATACTATRGFHGVGGSGPDDVWVVGGNWPAEGGASSPIVFHWDGSAWSSQAGVPGGGLNSVWSSAANDVWFAGDTTLRWNGTAWTTPIGELDYTRAVWGDGSGAVWAVGLDGRTARFDASGMQTTPSSGTSQALFGVWGSGSSDVWAVGIGGTLLHWQGTSWTPSTIPVTTSSLNAISGTASNDVWSVGDAGTIVHWDGATWSSTPSGTTTDLEGVWADGGSDVWAVGGHNAGIVLHFDGTTWSQSYHGNSELYAVWGTSTDDVWAVGDGLTVVHWNGSKWTSTHLNP